MGFITAKAHFQQCINSLHPPKHATEGLRDDYQRKERESLYNGLIDLTQGLEEIRILIKEVKKIS